VGDILGGLVMGVAVDKISNRFAMIFQIILTLVSLFFIITFNNVNEFNHMAYIMTFFWGF